MNKQIAALATDEETIVMWDIDSLLSNYKDHPILSVAARSLIPRHWLTIDTQYALTTDVELPVILFELPNNQLYIADGNHRVYRAAKENVQSMNVIIIPEETHLNYLFRSSIETYHRVIDGLKNEGIFIHNFLNK